MLVKICGIRRPEDAQIALDAGADLIGIILVPKRSRTVDIDTARAISKIVHEWTPRDEKIALKKNSYQDNSGYFARKSQDFHANATTPKLVGVFMNQDLQDILRLQKEIGLDYVQLHGKEPLGFAKTIPVPVIKRFTPGSELFDQWGTEEHHSAILIDGETGGNGKLVDWSLLKAIPEHGAPFILGGGLTPENVASAVKQDGVFAVDVSSGVEGEDGWKDQAKVIKFVENAKRA